MIAGTPVVRTEAVLPLASPKNHVGVPKNAPHPEGLGVYARKKVLYVAAEQAEAVEWLATQYGKILGFNR